MIGVGVTYRSDEGLDRGRVMGVAEKAAPAARAFFSPQLTERVTGLYGVAPEIRFVEIAALVDNGVGAAV